MWRAQSGRHAVFTLTLTGDKTVGRTQCNVVLAADAIVDRPTSFDCQPPGKWTPQMLTTSNPEDVRIYRAARCWCSPAQATDEGVAAICAVVDIAPACGASVLEEEQLMIKEGDFRHHVRRRASAAQAAYRTRNPASILQLYLATWQAAQRSQDNSPHGLAEHLTRGGSTSLCHAKKYQRSGCVVPGDFRYRVNSAVIVRRSKEEKVTAAGTEEPSAAARSGLCE